LQSLHVCGVVSSEILNEQTTMHMINSTRLLQNNIFQYYVYDKIGKRITYSCKLTTSIHWHCYCTAHVYIVINFCDRIRSVRVEENMWRVFYRLFISVLPLENNYQKGEGWDPMNWFNTATMCACPNPEPRFPTSYVAVFYYIQWF
jgi:hypothetical protein